ncbi:uncharacterized protein LOC117226839 isoform X1 [Megalopta genalis]|uniref:uncharacterized protein LOC117226839 isoform X1 n=1 Tax=Megalopta genalis TaxID=115081 RepID=UPI003FD18584
MSGQSGGHRLRLSRLNDQLTCKLCGGYFIDATTIIECLHSFCRSCIVKYLENNKYCPICEVQVHKNKPLLNIRPDYTLQDIVYKLVPGCYQNEMRCRRDFYSKHPEASAQTASPEARGEPTESHIYSPDESLSLSLEYFSPSNDVKEIAVKPFLRRYLRCPAAVTIFHLQKLIRAKYGLTDAHRVDVMYKEEPLHSSYTLMDVMYIYHWRRKVPLHLSYRIFESSPKRIKLSEDNVNYKTSLLHAGINPIDSEEEKIVKREWKEVQLKISETGIMSITDISDQEFKKNTKAEESVTNIETVNTTPVQENINNRSEIAKSNEESLNKQITDDESFKTIDFDNRKTIEVEKISMEEAEDVKTKNEEKPKNESDNNNVEIKSNVQSQEITQCVDEIEAKCNVGDDKDKKESSKNNNNIIIVEKKPEFLNHHSKNETKLINTGSKINALSVKLQFQPKTGQINNSNNSSLKKTVKDRKVVPQASKKVDTNSTEVSNLAEGTTNSCGVTVNKTSSTSSTKIMSPKPEEVKPAISTQITVTSNSESEETKTNAKNVQLAEYQHNGSEKKTVDQASTESTQKVNVQTITVPQKSPHTQAEPFANEKLSTLNLTASLSGSVGNGINTPPTPTVSQSTHTFSYTVQDIVNSTMLKNSLKSLATSTAQKLSVTTIPENMVTSSMAENSTIFTMSPMSISSSLKNSYPTSVMSSSKANLEITSVYSAPPCPDAIPISLMKPTIRKNELITKGSNLNEICAKIGASGSKINDICAKIGENSKEKNKTETRNKSDIPDLLKIGRKGSSSSASGDAAKQQHLANISNVPVYTPNSTMITTENKNIYSNVKDGHRATSLVSASPMTTSHSIQKTSSASKKQTQTVGYKTLRDPPRCWNPTLSKNNYVAVKNQSKETQSQLHQTALSERSKTIQSKPAKIFKMRNMPRYLGNPASGVKPMYGIGNDSKEKEQSTITPTSTTNTSSSSKNGNLSMMKIDPKTLSPIVSTINSPIVSPPPYSPSARNYPNPPFSRDICRSTGSSISPKNSPVNMLSTSPFIPSPTPNINPRLIYPHFAPPFPDASRFPNPLIRSPIGIPSPSAFHSSLPPSINKLYQRSSYIPQTTGFSSVSQPPTVQRIPPSTYSSPKSPKTTSLTAISPTSYSLAKTEAQIVATTSLETNNLLLLENAPQEDLSAFNLSKTGSFSSAENVTTTETIHNSKPTVLPAVSNVGQSKTSASKSKPESSQVAEQAQEGSLGCNKVQGADKKRSDEVTDTVNKKREKSVSQMNGSLAGKTSDEGPMEKKEQNETQTDGNEKQESNREKCGRTEEQEKRSEIQTSKTEVQFQSSK